jgi:hypothetical protein
MNTPTPKNAQDLAKIALLKAPATDYLPQSQNAKHFAELLIQNGQWMGALHYMAIAIPAREGIWWAWYCARKAHAKDTNPAVAHALSLAEKWIGQPTDENRKIASAYAERGEVSGAPHHVLQAIEAAGETEDPATGKKFEALPFVSSRYVYAATVASSYSPDPNEPQAAANEYLKQAFEVANRIQLWGRYQ